MIPKTEPPIEEVLRRDRTRLPAKLRRKLRGVRRREVTQVTRLLEEMEEAAAEAKEEMAKAASSAQRISREIRRPKSYPKLMILSEPPPTVEEEGS